MTFIPTEFPSLCRVVDPRGSSADSLFTPSSSWVLLCLQGPGREPAQLQEKLQEFEGGGSCFLGMMQLCWEGFVIARRTQGMLEVGWEEVLSHTTEEFLKPP